MLISNERKNEFSYKNSNIQKLIVCSYILITIILIFIYYYAIYSLVEYSFSEIIDKFNIHRVPKLFFGLVTVESASARRKATYYAWIQDILKYGHDYVFCTENKIEPMYKWIPLKNWTVHYPKATNGMFVVNRDRENKRVTMCNYFLQTDADFYINPTDDVFVDASRINEFARILGSKYNTRRDLIIKGNCMFNILHGGSGYIFTRAMAHKFVNLSDRWLRESAGPDDLEMNKFLGYMNKTIKDGASPYMSGRSFNIPKSHVINPTLFPICNTSWYDKRCNQGIYKLDDVYLMHPSGYKIYENIDIWNNFKALTKNKTHHFGWYPTSEQFHRICRFD